MSDTPDPPPLAVPPEGAGEPPPGSAAPWVLAGSGLVLGSCGGLLLLGSCMQALGTMHTGRSSPGLQMAVHAGEAAVALGGFLVVCGLVTGAAASSRRRR